MCERSLGCRGCKEEAESFASFLKSIGLTWDFSVRPAATTLEPLKLCMILVAERVLLSSRLFATDDIAVSYYSAAPVGLPSPPSLILANVSNDYPIVY